jgi:hypothetical protein
VISARLGTDRAARLRGTLVRGEEVLIGWSVQESGILDTIGGHPALLQDGVITPAACSGGGYFCDRHPRTGVGVTPEGHLLLVTVDGRQPGRSVGMTPLQFARLFLYLGATNALNLDGGGSTAMVVNGRLVNRPSDGAERPVGSALLVLPGPDPGEAEPGVAASEPGAGRNSGASPGGEPPTVPALGEQLPAAAAGCLALHDPASTGGMLDALARSPLTKGSHEVPPVVRRSVAVFRGREPCPGA